MAKLQFLPSCLAGNFIVIGGIALLTLLFGRIYCSVICPLGVYQDLIIWIRRQIGLFANKVNVKRKVKAAQARKEGREVEAVSTLKAEVKHFKYNRERRLPRYIVLELTALAVFADIQLLVALIEPYSAYGRMVHTAVGMCGGADIPVALMIAAAATLIIISVSAWLWGRAWCSNICPVGSLLGIISRFSLFKIRFDVDKCTACGRCGRGCKASCIDMHAHTVDASRCLVCFDCIGRCKEGAISYGPRKKSASKAPSRDCTSELPLRSIPPTDSVSGPHPLTRPRVDTVLPVQPVTVPRRETAGRPPKGDNGASRRAFLTQAAMLTSIAVLGQEKRKDGGLAEIEDKQVPQRWGRIVPPGAGSVKDFYSRCTACQLCIASCPNSVLRPSTDLGHLLQPEMGYEKGFCRPECTACGEVCPAGAIRPVGKEEKLSIHIGMAEVNEDLCIGCAKCSTICPSGAILMINEDGRKLATVVDTQCIGCGKCEFLCPVRPISAITVNGLEEHRHDE